MTSIEVLEEMLELLKITEEYVLDKNIEPVSLEEILTVLIPVVYNGIA